MLVRVVKFKAYLKANINNKSRLRYLWKTPLRFSSWVCLGSLNRSSPTLDDSSRTYQTAFRNRLWRSSTHWLINGYPHPLWRRNKHHNRVIRRDFYPVRVVQQENDRQHRFSLRGSHQLSIKEENIPFKKIWPEESN